MDLKERRHRTLTHGHCGKDFQFTTSSLDHDECRVPTQKSYSSSETLKAFDHDSSRLLYGGHIKEMVHREADEYSHQGESPAPVMPQKYIMTSSSIEVTCHTALKRTLKKKKE